MMAQHQQNFIQALDQWQANGQTARFWLRDDDAIAPSPALERLIVMARTFHAPILLAIIPKGATAVLAQRLADEPLMLPAQHGFSHANHAGQGEKPQELGLHRGQAAVLGDLANGREKLLQLFGQSLRPVLVPPWNRIDPALLPHLPDLGFEAISTFGALDSTSTPPVQLDCHVDIIDWKATRQGHPPEKMFHKLVEALNGAQHKGHAPIGVLTHHLVHGPHALSFLEALGTIINNHPAARWISFDDLMAEKDSK